MITSCLGELSDHTENMFKLSRRKVLFIFFIFVFYKVISISLDLTFKYLQFSLQIILVGFQVECSAPIGPGDQEENKFILNCKYIFN